LLIVKDEGLEYFHLLRKELDYLNLLDKGGNFLILMKVCLL